MCTYLVLDNSQLTQAVDATKGIVGDNIYIFVPPDRRFFLGELILTAGATWV
jgi:hypothetical protein